MPDCPLVSVAGGGSRRKAAAPMLLPSKDAQGCVMLNPHPLHRQPLAPPEVGGEV